MFKNLKFFHKLLIILASLFIPLILVTSSYFINLKSQGSEVLEKQLNTLPILRQIENLIDKVQHHQSLIVKMFTDSRVSEDELVKESIIVSESLQNLLTLIKNSHLESNETLTIKEQIEANFNHKEIGKLISYDAYASIIENLVQYSRLLGLQGGLFSGISEEQAILNQLLSDSIPVLFQNVSFVMGYGLYKATVGEMDNNDLRTLVSHLTIAEYTSKKVTTAMQSINKMDPSVVLDKNLDSLNSELEKLLSISTELSSSGHIKGNAKEFETHGLPALQEIKDLYENIYQRNLAATEKLYHQQELTLNSLIALAIFVLFFSLLLTIIFTRSYMKSLNKLIHTTNRVADGERNIVFPSHIGRDEIGKLFNTFKNLYDKIVYSEKISAKETSRKDFLSRISETLQGDLGQIEFAKKLLHFIHKETSTLYGLFFKVINQNNQLEFVSGSGYEAHSQQEIDLIVQKIQDLIKQSHHQNENIFIKNISPNHIKEVHTGLWKLTPQNIYIAHISFEQNTIGIIELGFHQDIDPWVIELLEEALDLIGVRLNSVYNRENINNLYQQSQQQAEELQMLNHDLEEKSQELSQQQDQLEKNNLELEQQQILLKNKNEDFERANIELKHTKEEIEAKAIDLEKASRYKSEFLANMSHELRSPLNSILILSEILVKNEKQELSAKHVEFAKTIHGSGSDLLSLIEDILDLSKVEAGKVSLFKESINVHELAKDLEDKFRPLIEKKKINFYVTVEDNTPKSFYSDRVRVEQIIRNFLGNAIKFTDHGSVSLVFKKGPDHLTPSFRAPLDEETIEMAVIDTGIGIKDENQQAVFRAFYQVDGGTSRKYGGAGLGLTISKNLSEILGGDVFIKSKFQEGSSFSLILPVAWHKEEPTSIEEKKPHLIVTAKPQEKELSKILIVEDDAIQRHSLIEIIESPARIITDVGSGHEAMTLLGNEKFDCLVLDLKLPGINGMDVLTYVKKSSPNPDTPVIVLTGKDLSEAERKVLDQYADSVVIKGQRSHERLKDEVTVFIERDKRGIMLQKKSVPKEVRHRENFFNNRCVLLVDDDIRNLFATMTLLENKGCTVQTAYNGKEAIETLEKNPKIELILMDMMMPDMDGYEATRQIRKNPRYHDIPIIAVTAKAMTGDKEKCLEAGASDYLSKPLEVEKLFSLFRIWLS